MHYSAGFLLGLGTGVVCLAYCGPVLLPYLMGEGKSISGNVGSISLFLFGRLVAYLIIGALAGLIGSTLLLPLVEKTVFLGILYIFLAVLLIAYGVHRFREVCLGRSQLIFKERFGRRWPYLVPLAGGFATGINLCPPFLLAITGAIETGKIGSSLLFFFMFFLGTMVYFIPLPFIGFFRKQQVLRVIGKFASILAGLLYLYKGIMMIAINN
jgi:sulfite exporter TauE/SafE